MDNLLIKNYIELNDLVDNYNSLDELNQKIVLVSSMYLLKLYIPIDFVIPCLHDNQVIAIKNIIKEHNFDYSNLKIGFYYSMYGPRICVEYHKRMANVKIPTKQEIVFKNFEQIEIGALKNIILNSVCYQIINEKSTVLTPQEHLYNKLLKIIGNERILKK